MAILQVNGRPAEKWRRRSTSRRREANHLPNLDNRAEETLEEKRLGSDAIIPHKSQMPTTTGAPAWPTPAKPNPDPPLPPVHGDNLEISWRLLPSTPVGRALVSASQRLEEANCEAARLDAQVLLTHVLGVDRSWLFAHHDAHLTEEQADAYTKLVARRARHEPVAYLLGRREFYGIDFVVDRRVLIPRPETELLVDLALAQIEARGERKVVVADVGTGSGAIGLTLVKNAPSIRLYGLDLSVDALDVARVNCNRLTPNGDIHLLQSNLLEKLPERADLIVANLPYVDCAEYRDLDPDIREYEPRLALESGEDGLDAIRQLLNQLDGRLNPGGAVLLEIGHQQGDAVAALAEETRPKPSYVGLRRDYSGQIRLVTLEF